MSTIRIGFAAMLLCWVAAVRALTPVPSPTGYVTDQTGVIEPQIMVQIQMQLAKYEVASGRKVVALLVPAIPGEELEAYADRVLEAWNIGEAKGGGALLLWTAEGYILIRAIGPALERLAGDAQSDILSRWVVPEFAQGRGGEGIRSGVERMMAVLDGEPVGFPPSAPEELAVDTMDMAAEGDSGIQFESAPDPASDSQPLPALFESMPQEIERLVQGVVSQPAQGLKAWIAEAGSQIAQLEVLFPAVLLQLRGEQVEPPFTATQINAFFVLIGAFVLAVVMLLRGALVAGLMVLGFGSGAALWVATGFTALAGVLFGVGLLAPVLAPLLRAVFRGADDSEREPLPVPTLPKPPAMRAPAPANRATTLLQSLTQSQQSGPRAAATPRDRHTLPPHLKHLEPVLQEAGQRFRAELGKLRIAHVIAGIALFLVAPFLAAIAVLGGFAFVMYRSGIAWLLSELIQDPQLKARLKARLPRPDDVQKS